jgi:hypothetical protein
MLDLTDPRWAELSTHSGDAGWVPRWLEELAASPDNLKVFEPDCWRLWSDENTWSASFAAAPYLVRIAARARAEIRIQYVKLLGLMAMYRTRPGWQGEYLACPSDLERDFGRALGEAAILASGLLPMTWSDDNTRMLIACIAAFKGYLPLARAIEDGRIWCPTCEKVVDCPMYCYE